MRSSRRRQQSAASTKKEAKKAAPAKPAPFVDWPEARRGNVYFNRMFLEYCRKHGLNPEGIAALVLLDHAKRYFDKGFCFVSDKPILIGNLVIGKEGK